MEWHDLSLWFKKNNSTFLNYMTVCIIGITHPSPSARQASIVLGLRLCSINSADKLPVFTRPAWLCAHPPLLGVRRVPTHPPLLGAGSEKGADKYLQSESKLGGSLHNGLARPSGYLDEEGVGRGPLLFASIGEGAPYMVLEGGLEVRASPPARTQGRVGRLHVESLFCYLLGCMTLDDTPIIP